MSVVATEVQPREPFLTLRLSPVLELTDEQFFELCQINSDLRMERTAEGEIIFMAPTGGETVNQKHRSFSPALHLDQARRDRRGV